MPTQTAMAAAAFVDLLGINTHIDFQNYGYQNITAVEQALSYLGVQNARDSAQNANDVQWWAQVSQATGVKFDDYIPEGSVQGMYGAMKLMPQLAAQGVLNYLEGPNEEDDSYPASLGNNLDYAKQAQIDLWKTYGDPSSSSSLHLPIINMSFGAGWTAANNWQGDYANEGDLSAYATYANAHTYPTSGQTPDYAIQRLNGLAQLAASQRPVMTTEIGWDTGSLSTSTAAKYTLDAAMDGAKDGDVKLYFYALFDDGSGNFGLMNQDGTPKPAGTALHNLISLMTDTGANAGSFTPASLSYSLSGTVSGDNSLVFQKSDGSFWVSLWNEQQAIGKSHTVTVNLPSAVAEVLVFDPLSGTTVQQGALNTSSIRVTIPDHPVLVEIVPSASNVMTVASSQRSITVPATVIGSQVLAVSGNHTVLLGGSGDTVRMTGGTETIQESGQTNTFVVPAAGEGLYDITGPVLSNGDVFDFRAALSNTRWDGLAGDVGSYLHISQRNGASMVSISTGPSGGSTTVLKLENTPSLSVQTLLGHSII